MACTKTRNTKTTNLKQPKQVYPPRQQETKEQFTTYVTHSRNVTGITFRVFAWPEMKDSQQCCLQAPLFSNSVCYRDQ